MEFAILLRVPVVENQTFTTRADRCTSGPPIRLVFSERYQPRTSASEKSSAASVSLGALHVGSRVPGPPVES
jgi:hypothetical protein